MRDLFPMRKRGQSFEIRVTFEHIRRRSFFKSSCINFYVTPFVCLIGSCVRGYMGKQKYKVISGSTCVISASC